MVNFPKERVTLEIPINGINMVGQEVAKNLLIYWDMPALPSDWAWVWKVGGKGEYVGTFPKRVAKYLYQKHGRKLSSTQLGELGTEVSTHCERNKSYTFDFTDSFDWDAGDFGDDGSCFWSCRTGAREMLEVNGARAVRFYDKDGEGYARAWVAPVDNGWIVFNGYGLESLQIARILSHYWGAYYKRAMLVNNSEDSGVLWINGGAGYVIADQADCKDSYDFGWEDIKNGRIVCYHCSEELDENEDYTYDGDNYCESCYCDMFFYCDDCEMDRHNEEYNNINNRSVCDSCLDSHYICCNDCDEFSCNEDSHEGPDGEHRCIDCHDGLVSTCHRCGCEEMKKDLKEGPDGNKYCSTCHDEMVSTCHHCGDNEMDEDLKTDSDGNRYCSFCAVYVVKSCEWCSESLMPIEADTGHHAECAEYVGA